MPRTEHGSSTRVSHKPGRGQAMATIQNQSLCVPLFRCLAFRAAEPEEGALTASSDPSKLSPHLGLSTTTGRPATHTYYTLKYTQAPPPSAGGRAGLLFGRALTPSHSARSAFLQSLHSHHLLTAHDQPCCSEKFQPKLALFLDSLLTSGK